MKGQPKRSESTRIELSYREYAGLQVVGQASRLSEASLYTGSNYSWDKLEQAYVISLIEKVKWNITATARQSGIKRTTFSSRMKKLGISRSHITFHNLP